MRPTPRRLLLVGTLATATATAAAIPATAADPPLVDVASAGAVVPGQYIVTLKDGASPRTTVSRLAAKRSRQFTGALNGFVARLDRGQLDRLRRDRTVAAIEQDQVVKAGTTQKPPLSWGLDRIDERVLPVSRTFTYRATGSGVNAYVIDTGIDAGHTQFGGRASVAWVAPRFNGVGADCNGHGTHVAGIVGGRTWGAAKSVRLRAMRVLDCEGSGYMSDIVDAANWLRANAAKPAVANLSVGGAKSNAVNTALENLSRSGVFTAVSAGNDGRNACNYTPASAGWVMAVGATTSYDNRATWSNYGGCVDINAPGYGIWSSWPGGGSKSVSGTSMAAPFVAGVAAMYLQTNKSATFPQVQKWLNDNSTKNRIGRLPSGSPNRLLYKAGL